MKDSLSVKSIAKYVISLAIAGVLLYLVFRNVDVASILNKLKEVSYQWVILAVVIFIISHIVRAYRWNLMLAPLGHRHLTIFRTLLAVLTAYFANLLIPRMGEVTRCGVLRQLDKVPITTSLGTVVAERLVDLLSLFALMALLFFTEFGRLNDFITGFWQEKFSGLGESVFAIYVFAGIAIVSLLIAYFLVRVYWEKLQRNTLFQKIQNLLKEVLKGMTSIAKIKQQGKFWLATVSMWFMYFLMSYVVFLAIPETSNLGASAGLAVLVMGSLGMAAPVQGGFGTFHALVSGVLLLYGIQQADGVLFATLIHGMQTVSFILMGGFAFFMVSVLSSRKMKTATTS
ncbi:MAG: lysylphosphatidylglycerol synthase transmembrane domain-containing protein [Bacteroidota bacterium]